MNTRSPVHGEPSFPGSQATPPVDGAARQLQTAACDAQRVRQFNEEFLCFLRGRNALRRFMPTADVYPLLCELVDEAKKFYFSLPSIQRKNLRHIPFFCFGKEWVIRSNFSATPLTSGAYIDLCDAKSKTTMVTVVVALTDDVLKAESDA